MIPVTAKERVLIFDSKITDQKINAYYIAHNSHKK